MTTKFNPETTKKLSKWYNEKKKARVDRFKYEYNLGLWRALPKGRFEWIRRTYI
jgi:hypothetical protein